MKLSPLHLKILDRGALGYSERWEWRWVLDGEPVTRQVKTLLRRGLVGAHYGAGGRASVHRTEAGAAALAKAELELEKADT